MRSEPYSTASWMLALDPKRLFHCSHRKQHSHRLDIRDIHPSYLGTRSLPPTKSTPPSGVHPWILRRASLTANFTSRPYSREEHRILGMYTTAACYRLLLTLVYVALGRTRAKYPRLRLLGVKCASNRTTGLPEVRLFYPSLSWLIIFTTANW